METINQALSRKAIETRARWALNVAGFTRHVGSHAANAWDVKYRRATALGERVDHDFVVATARGLDKRRAKLTFDTSRLVGLCWPADGLVVVDADMVEKTGKSGSTYHVLINWDVVGIRRRTSKALRAEDIPTVVDDELSTEHGPKGN